MKFYYFNYIYYLFMKNIFIHNNYKFVIIQNKNDITITILDNIRNMLFEMTRYSDILVYDTSTYTMSKYSEIQPQYTIYNLLTKTLIDKECSISISNDDIKLCCLIKYYKLQIMLLLYQVDLSTINKHINENINENNTITKKRPFSVIS